MLDTLSPCQIETGLNLGQQWIKTIITPHPTVQVMNEQVNDHRSYIRNSSSSEKKA